jgi:hypothetical protein
MRKKTAPPSRRHPQSSSSQPSSGLIAKGQTPGSDTHPQPKGYDESAMIYGESPGNRSLDRNPPCRHLECLSRE